MTEIVAISDSKLVHCRGDLRESGQAMAFGCLYALD